MSPEFSLQNDNSRSYVSRFVQKYVTRYNIQVMIWSVRNTYLNPIERMHYGYTWEALEDRFLLRNLEHVKEVDVEEWDRICQ